MSTNAELIAQYAAGPAALRQAVAGLTPEQLKSRPVPGKWSTLEVVAHLADFEPVLADRMMRVISHERALLLVADENLFHATLSPNARDLEEELTLIEATRKKMTRLLKALPDEAFNRMGVHTFKGLVPLSGIVSGAVHHIDHHAKFIAEKRTALGV